MQKSLAAGLAAALAPLTGRAGSTGKIGQLPARVVRADEGKKVNVLGDKQRFKLTGEDTYGQFTLIEETNDPGTAIPPHVHSREDEIFHVLEGEMEITVGGETTVLKAGDMAFGPRGIPHAWRITGDKPARVLLSVFPAGLERMFEELGQLPAGPPDMGKVTEICGRYGIRFMPS